MPPAPKPPERRQRRNATGAGLTLAAPPEDAPPPAPRAGLLKVTREGWSAFWASPVARATAAHSDLMAVHRLFTLYDERERALRGYRRERVQADRVTEREMDDGTVLRVVQGLKVNPLVMVLKAFDAEIRLLEDRFGLSPKSRLQLGIQLAGAKKTLDDMNEAMGDDADGDDPRSPVAAVVVEHAADPGAAGL